MVKTRMYPYYHPPSDLAADPSIDDEDMEEQITALAVEIEAALKDLPTNSEEVKNASKLLVKLHGFVAKVLCAWFYNIWGSTFLINRSDSHLKPRSISRNVVQMLRLQSSSFFHTAKLIGVPGMGWSLEFLSWEKWVFYFVTNHDANMFIHLEAITLFLSTADESDEVPSVDKDQPQYDSYKFTLEEWELMTKIKKVMNISS